MKNKVLIFIIGLLIGAIIATSGFLAYFKVFANNNQSDVQINEDREMGDPPSGNNNAGEPGDLPEGGNDEEPPEVPDNENADNA